LSKAYNVLESIFPNKNIGSALGTPLGGIYTALTDPKALKYYDWNPHVTPGGMLGDVAGDVINAGSLVMAPETGGTSLLARSGVNAAIGGGLSLANSASQGQSLTSAGALENAAGSATLSAIFPFLGKSVESVSNAAKNASGITPQIEKVLQKSTPAELNEYIQTVLTHNSNLETPTATGLMASKLDEAANAIVSKREIAGQAVGKAIEQDGSKMIGQNLKTGNFAIDDALSNFNKKLETRFGHEVTYSSGDNTALRIAGETMHSEPLQEPVLSPLTGRSRVITPADKTRILTIHNYLTDLADKPTLATASDVVHNLDDLIDYSKVDKIGINHDPLQGIILSTRGEINGAIRETSPALATANDTFSKLKGIENEIGDKAGGDLQRSGLIMRRVFSGDQSGKSLQLFNDIKNETGIDLFKHAGLAKFATDNFGNESSRSLLEQELNQGGSIASGMKKSLLAPAKNLIKKLVVPDTEKFANKITKGIPYSGKIDELLNSTAGRGLLRTYLNNLSAAHPEIGKGIDSSLGNAFKNIMSQSTPKTQP
jgi:hypothetical protein